MKPRPSIQISIPQPCHEDWDKMTSQEQGRFCDSCQKCVMDFTGYSDEQLYLFLAQHRSEKICGRLNASQLKRQLLIPYQRHGSLYRWMIAAGFALALSAANPNYAFSRPPMIHISQVQFQTEDDSANMGSAKAVRGQIKDYNGDAVYGAEIRIVTEEGAIYSTNTDTNGNFAILLPQNTKEEKAIIIVTSIGYRECKTSVTTFKQKKEQNIVLLPGSVTGLLEFEIMEYEVPLIDKFQNGNSKTLTSDEIENGAW